MSEALLRFEQVHLPGSGISLTLDVPAHRATILVGPEASGVDAVASYALALSPPPAGRVLLYGKDLATLARPERFALRRAVGYLPSGNGLLHNLSLRDNVALPLRFGSDLAEREIAGRIRVMLGLLQLAEAADLRPAEATEEQRRRAALARALAFDPDLVILADPFDGMGHRTAAELLALARGGETPDGSRRAVFITGQYVPDRLIPRIEARYRLHRGELRCES